MLITHDTRCALDTVVDLVNTAPEDDATADGLADVAALEAFVRDHKVSEVGVLTEFDLAAVRKIRGRFAAVFAAPDARSAATTINELIAAAGTTPRLTDHDGYDWHVHYFAPAPPWPTTWPPTAGWRWRSSWSPVSGSVCAAARRRTAGTPSSTCHATARAATATAAPAATGCMSPPTGRAARGGGLTPPGRHGA